MDTEHGKNGPQFKKILPILALLIVVAFALGWALNRPQNNTTTPSESPQPTASTDSDGPDVKAAVSYTLPTGWKEATCPEAEGAVFFLPPDAEAVNCAETPSAPVKMSVDTAGNTDCNQLQSVQNVSKHTCVSEFIHGKKSLKAETVYNEQSAYKRNITVHAYYINTGEQVIKVEYVFTEDNKYQLGWEELAKSVQAKS